MLIFFIELKVSGQSLWLNLKTNLCFTACPSLQIDRTKEFILSLFLKHANLFDRTKELIYVKTLWFYDWTSEPVFVLQHVSLFDRT